MRWWLVSDKDLSEVRKLLSDRVWSQECRDTLHHLETGMHKTDAVPSDFAGEINEKGV